MAKLVTWKNAMNWKPDWQVKKQNYIRWWEGKGLVVNLTAPRERPAEDLPRPSPPDDVRQRWLDPKYRVDQAVYQLANRHHAADAFPLVVPQIGPGSLGMFLGCRTEFAPETVWYEPCIADPDSYGPIRFDPANNPWWEAHLAIIDEALRRAAGRYVVGMPDLIENLDTLAALRGSEQVLLDLVERPGWVRRSLAEINQAFFAAFDLIHQRIKDADGGNCFVFDIWGPGKTAKVQCDLCCMIGREMFARFVVPHLKAQCDWLDYSMFHLDGETALTHLDALLEIPSLNAIEWTPMGLSVNDPSRPHCHDPRWFPMYRRIRQAGKSLQLVSIKADQVIPLIEALGPEGLYLRASADSQAQAERVAAQIEQYQ